MKKLPHVRNPRHVYERSSVLWPQFVAYWIHFWVFGNLSNHSSNTFRSIILLREMSLWSWNKFSTISVVFPFHSIFHASQMFQKRSQVFQPSSSYSILWWVGGVGLKRTLQRSCLKLRIKHEFDALQIRFFQHNKSSYLLKLWMLQ